MTTGQPVHLAATDYDGSRTIEWARADGTNVEDPGQWSGDTAWVELAHQILQARTPVCVLQPSVTYFFPALDTDLTVENVAAAIIGAVEGRADVSDVLEYLPAELVDDEPGQDSSSLIH